GFVMLLEQLPPSAVAVPHGLLGRADDVGEQDRGQGPGGRGGASSHVRQCGGAGSVAPTSSRRRPDPGFATGSSGPATAAASCTAGTGREVRSSSACPARSCGG